MPPSSQRGDRPAPSKKKLLIGPRPCIASISALATHSQQNPGPVTSLCNRAFHSCSMSSGCRRTAAGSHPLMHTIRKSSVRHNRGTQSCSPSARGNQHLLFDIIHTSFVRYATPPPLSINNPVALCTKETRRRVFPLTFHAKSFNSRFSGV